MLLLLLSVIILNSKKCNVKCKIESLIGNYTVNVSMNIAIVADMVFKYGRMDGKTDTLYYQKYWDTPF